MIQPERERTKQIVVTMAVALNRQIPRLGRAQSYPESAPLIEMISVNHEPNGEHYAIDLYPAMLLPGLRECP